MPDSATPVTAVSASAKGLHGTATTLLADLRDLADSASPRPWHRETSLHGDLTIIGDVVRGRYGSNALSFDEDRDTARLVERAVNGFDRVLLVAENLLHRHAPRPDPHGGAWCSHCRATRFPCPDYAAGAALLDPALALDLLDPLPEGPPA